MTVLLALLCYSAFMYVVGYFIFDLDELGEFVLWLLSPVILPLSLIRILKIGVHKVFGM